MLRHAFATEVREAFGLDGAQVLLGHTKVTTTQVYAEKSQQLAVKVASKIG
jgi:site-specific recombinase XerC